VIRLGIRHPRKKNGTDGLIDKERKREKQKTRDSGGERESTHKSKSDGESERQGCIWMEGMGSVCT